LIPVDASTTTKPPLEFASMIDNQNKGPIYGVVLYEEMPIGDKGWKQAFPDRDELEEVREQVGDRTVAAFEVLTAHHRALNEAIARGGYDVSVCMDCGFQVVCIPDGLAMCLKCVEKSIEVAAEAERAAS
jgi:hypothetical protein